MYGIYTYIPQTNPVPSGYTAAANLSIHRLALISFLPAPVLLRQHFPDDVCST